MSNEIDERIISLLRGGGVGVLPTDTIYGLSCLALNKQAVEKIHELKGRSSNKPLIVLISDIKMLKLLSISIHQAQLIKNYWPGALSLVFDAPGSPNWLHRGTRSLAVRMPSNLQLITAVNKTGPIVSTSVNLQGQDPVRSILKAKSIFGDKLDFYVDAGKLDNPPSTLAVIKDNKFKVIRQGAVIINQKELI